MMLLWMVGLPRCAAMPCGISAFFPPVVRWAVHFYSTFRYYNNPKSCSYSQSILFHCRVTLHVSGAFYTLHQEYIKVYLQPPVQVILSLQLPSSNMAKFEFKLGHVGISGIKHRHDN